MDKQTNSTSDWFYQINKQHVGPFQKMKWWISFLMENSTIAHCSGEVE